MQGIVRPSATAFFVGLVLLGCGNGVSDSPYDDFKITVCDTRIRAGGTIDNATKKASAYTFRVRFLDISGDEVSQVKNGVGRVEPGSTVNWYAGAGDGDNTTMGPVTCNLDSVIRTALP